jgi:hypothetical protein
MPSLLPAEQAAAIGALPDGTVTGTAPVSCRAEGARADLRGTVLNTTWTGAAVTVQVGSAATTTGAEPSAAPESSFAEVGGSLTVYRESAGTMVAVTANPAAAAHFTAAQLRAVAIAVLAAAG